MNLMSSSLLRVFNTPTQTTH